MTIPLRAPEERDIPALMALYNCPGVRHGTLRLPFTREALVRQRITNPMPGLISVVAEVDGAARAMGFLLPGRDRRAHKAEIGVMVHDDWTRQGLGRAVMSGLIETADDWLGLQRIELDCYADNHGAIALYRDLGFEVEGRRRADALRAGQLMDSLVMARLRPPPPLADASGPVAPRVTSFAQQDDLTTPATTTPPLLRAPRTEDIAALQDLIRRQAVQPNTSRLPWQDASWVAERIEKPSDDMYGLVAERDGTAIGWGWLQRGAGRMAHAATLSISVHDAHHRTGVGRCLMTGLLDLADNWLGLRRIGLEVRDDNTGAIALYRAFGFEDEGLRRGDLTGPGGTIHSRMMGRVVAAPAIETSPGDHP